jgi:hypothetical protein
MSEDQALRVMITAHRRGVCVVAVFTKDVAQAKATNATRCRPEIGLPAVVHDGAGGLRPPRRRKPRRRREISERRNLIRQFHAPVMHDGCRASLGRRRAGDVREGSSPSPRRSFSVGGGKGRDALAAWGLGPKARLAGDTPDCATGQLPVLC